MPYLHVAARSMDYWASWVVHSLELPVAISSQFLTRSEDYENLNYPLSRNLRHRSHPHLQGYFARNFEEVVEGFMDFEELV